MSAFKEYRYYEMDLRMQMDDGTVCARLLAEQLMATMSDIEIQKFMEANEILSMDQLEELDSNEHLEA